MIVSSLLHPCQCEEVLDHPLQLCQLPVQCVVCVGELSTDFSATPVHCHCACPLCPLLPLCPLWWTTASTAHLALMFALVMLHSPTCLHANAKAKALAAGHGHGDQKRRSKRTEKKNKETCYWFRVWTESFTKSIWNTPFILLGWIQQC